MNGRSSGTWTLWMTDAEEQPEFILNQLKEP
jgi:hypothetical protein